MISFYSLPYCQLELDPSSSVSALVPFKYDKGFKYDRVLHIQPPPLVFSFALRSVCSAEDDDISSDSEDDIGTTTKVARSSTFNSLSVFCISNNRYIKREKLATNLTSYSSNEAMLAKTIDHAGGLAIAEQTNLWQRFSYQAPMMR
jgi:hypothetical protein